MVEKKIDVHYTIFKNSSELSSSENTLYLKVIEARKNANAPYSNFNVGASVLLKNGIVVDGNNQENAAYPSGMCAERVAIWNAASQHPNIEIDKIFISASSSNKKTNQPVAPCGACRQVLIEYEINQSKNIAIYFTGETGKIIKIRSVKDLLPLAFDNSLL